LGPQAPGRDRTKGQTIGVDATTLEANAAMRSIVRKHTGEGYLEFLTGLTKASGIATPTREDLAKLDRKGAVCRAPGSVTVHVRQTHPPPANRRPPITNSPPVRNAG